jgi:predicted amidohydrolase
MVAAGAAALFVPTNNGLPLAHDPAAIVAEARRCDRALAMRHGVPVIRADVAGRDAGLVSHGSSAITHPDGRVVAARPFTAELLVAEVESAPRPPAAKP